MNKLLVHIITGVENPSRSVLGFLVAKSAIEDGNDVKYFAQEMASHLYMKLLQMKCRG